MRKIIWSCWFQGAREAPDLVRKCLRSWELRNPGWIVRCLDATTIRQYIDIDEYISLSRQSITAASLSDIVRILLLHEYGGVWVDATLFCNESLDSWLPPLVDNGFFAFSDPAPDRMLSSWFLAGKTGNKLVTKWASRTAKYWQNRYSSQEYFWFHNEFAELYASDAEARAAWNAVPRLSADGPHRLQDERVFALNGSLLDAGIDPTIPVFKLSHRMDESALRPGSVIASLLGAGDGALAVNRGEVIGEIEDKTPTRFVGLRTGTLNLGDHIQILASDRLLRRVGVEVEFRVDRDDEIAASRVLDELPSPAGILLNGWFKSNPAQWPPHRNLIPMYLGFHVRLFQAPSLVAEPAIENYATFGPVGCRDNYTTSLLRQCGVDSFLSNCLSLLISRRLEYPETQTEVFVVSRDERIREYIPPSVGDYEFVNQYAESDDFDDNLVKAKHLLDRYKQRARLIITTMLHCALPAIAMGIPVIIFYPVNHPEQHQSDRERFSTLERMIRVYHLSEAHRVNWAGRSVDASEWKFELIEAFLRLAGRWTLPSAQALGPIAAPQTLPVPTADQTSQSLLDTERLRRLNATRTADRRRWRDPASYKPEWAARAQLAASLLPDGVRVLEIGAGRGVFRELVGSRCNYTGADLEPLERDLIALDLDCDPLPTGRFDFVVALGVFEYLHHPLEAAIKICRAASNIIVSYAAVREVAPKESLHASRQARGWVNEFTKTEFLNLFIRHGFVERESIQVSEDADSQQYLLLLSSRAV